MKTNETGEKNRKEKHEDTASAAEFIDNNISENPTDDQGVVTDNTSDQATKENTDWKDKYLRLYAEFDNYRKRTSREKMDILSQASGAVIKELLPVLDDFERAVKANENLDDPQSLKEGFSLIYQKLYRILESNGLRPMDAVGKTFDTDFHEAITSVPVTDEKMKGTVVDEIEKGYLMNEKVLRYSKVITGQ